MLKPLIFNIYLFLCIYTLCRILLIRFLLIHNLFITHFCFNTFRHVHYFAHLLCRAPLPIHYGYFRF